MLNGAHAVFDILPATDVVTWTASRLAAKILGVEPPLINCVSAWSRRFTFSLPLPCHSISPARTHLAVDDIAVVVSKFLRFNKDYPAKSEGFAAKLFLEVWQISPFKAFERTTGMCSSKIAQINWQQIASNVSSAALLSTIFSFPKPKPP